MFTDEFVKELADAVAERITAPASATRRLMSVAEAAEYLGRTRSAVVHMIQRGTIPVTKIGGRLQVDRAALDRLIEENTFFEA